MFSYTKIRANYKNIITIHVTNYSLVLGPKKSKNFFESIKKKYKPNEDRVIS